MNRGKLKLFFIVILSFVALDQKCSDDKNYLELLPEGKIREFCLKPSKEHLDDTEKFLTSSCIRTIAWKIGIVVNKKKRYSFKIVNKKNGIVRYSSKMTKFEKSAYDFVAKRSGGSNLEYAIYRIADELKWSFDETCQETAKVTEMYSKLEEEAEKAWNKFANMGVGNLLGTKIFE